MTKKICFWSLLGILSASWAGAVAEDLKIGTVDMQTALRTVEAGKKAKSSLEGQVSKKRDEIEKEGKDIKKMIDELQNQTLVLSEQAKAKKQAEVQQRIQKFEESKARAQMEFAQKEQDLTGPIIEGLKSVVEEVAKEKGYQYILEKSANNVLFSPEKDDLTDEVIERYNKKNKG